MRKIILIILVFFLSPFAAAESFAQCACSITYRNISAHNEFKLADVVFIGKVIEISNSTRDKNTNSYVQIVKFKVEKAWKRDLETFVIIRNEIQGCIIDYKENEEWLVYAYKNQDGSIYTYCCCSRTKPLLKAAEDLEEFEAKGKQPANIRSPRK